MVSPDGGRLRVPRDGFGSGLTGGKKRLQLGTQRGDRTLEEIQYELYLRQKLEKSRAAAAQGRLVPHREVKKRLSVWLER